MRIGIDARHAELGLGIATFLTGLGAALCRRGDCDVVWLGRPATAPDGVVDAVPVPGPYPLLDGPWGRRWVRRLGLDIVHFAGNTGWGRPGPVPAVLTVHDLIFFDRARRRSARQRVGHAYMRANVGRAVAAAAEVATVSEITAGALAARFGGQAHVIGHGVAVPATAGRQADPPYLLAFGGRDPRKGVGLMATVAEAAGLPLHLTGRAGLPRDFTPGPGVTVHPDLERAELDALVDGALAVLYLSSHEGFGLPVVEAMARGTPVVTGLAPVTRKVAGGAALLVDPDDVLDTAVAHVRQLADDPGHRRAVAEAGRRAVDGRGWADVAAAYAELYARALR